MTTKKAEELDYGDHVAGYSHPLREVVLTKDGVQGITELGDVVKFDRGATVELATPWPQGILVGYLYDWRTGVIGSGYDADTENYLAYTTLSGYRFTPGDNLGKYSPGTIVPSREMNELHVAYTTGGYEEVVDAVKNLLSAMGRMN